MKWTRLRMACVMLAANLCCNVAILVAADDEITSITVTIDKAFTSDHAADKSATLTREDVAKLPREQAQAAKKGEAKQTYEGPTLSDVLQRAGLDWKQRCGVVSKGYVVVAADDGYQALFAIPEIHPKHAEHRIILADSVDGHKLAEQDGTWKIVEHREGFVDRGVRLVTAISVKVAPDLPVVSAEKTEKTEAVPGK